MVAALLLTHFRDALAMRNRFGHEPPPPLGAYRVTAFQEDGRELPAQATGGHRWKSFELYHGHVVVRGFDQSMRLFKIEGDAAKGDPFTLFQSDEAGSKSGRPPAGKLTLRLPSGQPPALEGTFDGHTVAVSLERADISQFPLMNRGFHWITERPYNR